MQLHPHRGLLCAARLPLALMRGTADSTAPRCSDCGPPSPPQLKMARGTAPTILQGALPAAINAHLRRQLFPERPCGSMRPHAAQSQRQDRDDRPSACSAANPHLDFLCHDRPLLRSIDLNQLPELLVLLRRPEKRRTLSQTVCQGSAPTALSLSRLIPPPRSPPQPRSQLHCDSLSNKLHLLSSVPALPARSPKGPQTCWCVPPESKRPS